MKKIPLPTCARESARVFTAKRNQSGGVIDVMVAEDNVRYVGEIDLKFAGVAQNRVRVSAGVEENSVAVGDNQSRETPLAEAIVVGEHRGEDAHLKRADSAPSHANKRRHQQESGQDRARHKVLR